MDLIAIIGFFLALLSLVVGFLWEGGHISALFQPSAALIVFGGTIGATIFSYSLKEVLGIPKLFKVALLQKHSDPLETIDLIVGLADEARREGLLHLENRLGEVTDPFLRKGIQLVVDGTDPDLVRNIMEVELYTIQERHHVGVSIFEAAGGYAPTMGIIGTVMGLVHVLGSISSPDKLASAIAVAFMATLYGVGSANILWLPLATKLQNLSKKEILVRELMVEGIVSLQAGYNPLLIRERLSSFLMPQDRDSAIEENDEI